MGYDTDGSSALDPDYDGGQDSDVSNSYENEAAGKGNVIDAAGSFGGQGSAGGGKVIDAKDRFGAGQDRWGNKMQQRASANRNAAAKLKGGENAAAGKVGGAKTVGDARSAEKSGSGFSNNVAGKAAEKAVESKVPGGKKIAEQAKKLGPFGGVLIVLAAVMTLFAGSQTLAPFGLVANGLDQFNSIRTAMNKRTTYFRRLKLDSTRNKSITGASIFGQEKFKVSGKMAKKLKKNKITYIDAIDGHPRMLVYTDPKTGNNFAIAANDADCARLPDSVEIDGKTISIQKKVKIDDAIDISDDFALHLDVGTRTIKGHVAGWFDSLSVNLHKRLNTFRNRFKDTSDTDSDENVKKAAKKDGLNEDLADVDTDAKERVDDGPDKDGNEQHHDQQVSQDSSGSPAAKLTNRAKAAVAAVGSMSQLACGAMKAYAAINLAIAGIQIAKVINYVTGFLEAIQKIQAGDGGSQLHFYMNSLSKAAPTTGYDENANEITMPAKSSLESTAFNQFFSEGDVVVDPNDPIARKYNKELTTKISMSKAASNIFQSEAASAGSTALNAAGYITNSIEAYSACNQVGVVAGAIDVLTDVLGFILTGGIGTAIKKLVGEVIMAAAIAVVAGAVISSLMGLVPSIANFLAVDVIENMAGEDAAYMVNSGFNIYLGRQHQTSSGLPGTKEQVVAQYKQTQQVIAEEAKFQRATHSPLDATNKYTFLGSIVSGLTPIANSLKNPLAIVSNTANVAKDSLVALLPTASAAGVTKFETSLNEDCPALSQVGLVGDAYCNPYIISRYSLGTDELEEDPADVFTEAQSFDANNFELGGADNVDTDGDGVNDAYNPTIKQGSNLDKWIGACATRNSQFGYFDSNVENWVSRTDFSTGISALDYAVSGAIGAIPVLGGLDDIRQASKDQGNLGWITGERCLSDEGIAYSKYSEDQRHMESAGLIDESSVSVALREYHNEPEDNSIEGIISRYSGMSKDEVNLALGLMEYGTFIANYDPTDKKPLEPVKNDNDYQYEDSSVIANVYKTVGKIEKNILFDDARDRILIV